jgi:uncharacterized membrane protein (UPF0127 family)
MHIKFKGKKIEIEAKKVSAVGQFTGLMFRTRNTKNLLFEFGSGSLPSIHSFFVFFPFLALWLDENDEVKDFHLVKPFSGIVSPNFPSEKLVEIPLNVRNTTITELFVGKRKDLNI